MWLCILARCFRFSSIFAEPGFRLFARRWAARSCAFPKRAAPIRTLQRMNSEKSVYFFGFFAIATIPGAIAGKLLEHSAEDYFREHIYLIAGALIVVALLMWWGEKVSQLTKPLTRISFVGCPHRRLRSGHGVNPRCFAVGFDHHGGLVPQYDA